MALRKSVQACGIWGLGLALLFTVGYGLLGEVIIALMVDIAEVRATASVYLFWVVLSPVVSIWSYLLDGIFLGATRTATMRNSTILACTLYAVFVAVLVPAFGNHSLWAALMILMVARAETLVWHYPALARSVAADPATAAGGRAPGHDPGPARQG